MALIIRDCRNPSSPRSTRARAARRLALGAGLVALLFAAVEPAWRAWAQTGRDDAGPVVARVGGSPIAQAELDEMTRQFEAAYQRDSGEPLTSEDRPNFRRLVLEQLIRSRLLRAEAHRLKIGASKSEVDQFLRGQPGFNSGGRFDAASWQAFTADAASYSTASTAAREVIRGSKLFERKAKEFQIPREEAVRRLRERGQGAEGRLLPFDTEWFLSEPAPDAEAIRAHYRTLQSSFQDPPRARVRVILVPFAAGPAADPSDADRRRTEARADSLLARLRGGVSFDSAAATFGGARADEWTAGRNAGVFFLDPAMGAEALRAPAGTVLPRPLRVPGGYGAVVVDGVEPARAAALSQVADAVRTDWAQNAAAARGPERVAEMRGAYPDSFRTRCVTWRAAVLDTTLLKPRDRDKVRERADKIAAAWRRGKRDQGAEKGARVYEEIRSIGGSGAPGGVPDVLRARALASTEGTTGVEGLEGGIGVWSVVASDPACALPDAEAELVAARLERARQEQEDEVRARALYDADPSRYPATPIYYHTVATVHFSSGLIEDISRARVEAYYRDHPEDFGQPGRVRVRHLLVRLPRGADTTSAYVRARALLTRAQAGEPFDSLTRRYSEDPITRDKGGDTDWFTRGMTGAQFESAAFAVRPGEIVGPVRSELGYHLIRGEEREEEQLVPLRLAYPAASDRVAAQIADSLSYQFADSLVRYSKSSADLRERALRRGAMQVALIFRPGEIPPGPAARPEVQEPMLAMKKPGLVPGGPFRDARSWSVVWLDSIVTPPRASWEDARLRALAEARAARPRDSASRAALAVRNELNRGAAWDSAAAPWGSGSSLAHRRGQPVPGIADIGALDSALFSETAPLASGQAVVVAGDRGPVVIQLVSASSTSGEPPTAQVEAFRNGVSERSFYEYFESLKKRHPVTILRPELNRPVAAPPAP
jgi:parvulin-like peptidyl-prolyl isomerase